MKMTTIKEIQEKSEIIMLNCPLCPECGEPMLQSMCIPYCEFVCVPCGIGKPFVFNYLKEVIEDANNK